MVRKEVNMDYNISEQIDSWTKKLYYYEQKEGNLRQRISTAESLRKEVDKLPVGSPKVDKFYRQLSSLYTQLSSLPAKVRHCKDNLQTLKCEL